MQRNNIIKFLRLGFLYHLILGLIFIFNPEALSSVVGFDKNHLLTNVSAVFYILFAFAYLITSIFLEENWLFVIMAILEKIFIAVIFSYFNIRNGFNGLSLAGNIIYSILWIYPLYQVLDYIFVIRHNEDDLQATYQEVFKNVRTNRGEGLMELSMHAPQLLVFVRHFGCTFCKETVSGVAYFEKEISERGLHPVFIHLSDPFFADKFFERYFNHEVSHISDPSRRMYRVLKIKRGNLWQLFGLNTIVRGFIARIKNNSKLDGLEGDVMQLGGYFVLDRGQIIFSHYNRNASEPFDLKLLPRF